jgi:RNA polymerase sigma factor (sigma-70 family)
MSTALILAQPSRCCCEQDLIAAVRRGDDRAFEELYARYRQRIHAYVAGMVGDHGRAEDVTQEVFISALRRMRATHRPITFKPWIYEIAKNACIDQSRRARRAREVPLEPDPEEHGPGASRAPLALVAAPESAVQSKQQLADLCGAFGGLSESHHQILVMRELEGRSYSEIGAELGMSRPVVESTLFRARRKLGEEYDEIASGRRCVQVCGVIDAYGSRSVRSLGVRERRRLARHLAHCQPCRRHAHLAGFDYSQLQPPSLAGRIAALLPIPWLGRAGAPGQRRAPLPVEHQLEALRISDTFVRRADGPLAGAGRAAAAAVAVALAGAGTGLVTGAVVPRAGPAGAAAVLSQPWPPPPHGGSAHGSPAVPAAPAAATASTASAAASPLAVKTQLGGPGGAATAGSGPAGSATGQDAAALGAAGVRPEPTRAGTAGVSATVTTTVTTTDATAPLAGAPIPPAGSVVPTADGAASSVQPVVPDSIASQTAGAAEPLSPSNHPVRTAAGTAASTVVHTHTVPPDVTGAVVPPAIRDGGGARDGSPPPSPAPVPVTPPSPERAVATVDSQAPAPPALPVVGKLPVDR